MVRSTAEIHHFGIENDANHHAAFVQIRQEITQSVAGYHLTTHVHAPLGLRDGVADDAPVGVRVVVQWATVATACVVHLQRGTLRRSVRETEVVEIFPESGGVNGGAVQARDELGPDPLDGS